MRRTKTRITIRIASLIAPMLLAATTAQGVIRVDLDLKGVRRFTSAILKGEVTTIDSKSGIVEARMNAFGRAKLPDEYARARLDLSGAPNHLKALAVGDPVAMFVGRRSGVVIHIGDRACSAKRQGTGAPAVVKITQVQEAWRTFPGPTRNLLIALGDLYKPKGTYTDHNSVDHWFVARYRKVVRLDGRPEWLSSGDVNGDGVPDLLSSVRGVIRMHVATAGGYEKVGFKDATQAWGLAGAKGERAAFGDANGDGRLDLLLGAGLYINDGARFTATRAITPLPKSTRLLAAGLGDANGDGRNDAILVSRKGQLFVFENGPTTAAWKALGPRTLWTERAESPTLYGAIDRFGLSTHAFLMVVRPDTLMRYSIDPADGKPLDYPQLSGEVKGSMAKSLPIDLAAATPIRILLGDRTSTEAKHDLQRASFFIMLPDAAKDFGLINRGYGCFITNGRTGLFRRKRTEGHKSAGQKGKTLIVPVAATVGEFNYNDGQDEILFATEDGQVYLGDNPSDIRAYDKSGLKWVNETP